ncbi:hypothetical protein BDR03DRAFT_933074 [Suillus americanus]|nr:hypothetical protein BDR03DRAFT_933074 [Suillus americanus]
MPDLDPWYINCNVVASYSACQRHSEQRREDLELARAICQGDPPPSGTASPAPQHDIDNIKVEYHPSSGIPTKVYHFKDYGSGPGAPPAVPEADPMPWQLFHTRIDFKVAELAHDTGLSHEQLDRLIHLIHHSRIELFTLKNRKDVRDTWDAASFKMTPFTKEEVTVPFQGVDQTFPLFHYPQVGLNFIFDVQRLSKFNGEKFVRFIHEPWTANAFWEYQSKIPPDAKPLAFILYADKAKFCLLHNLPIAICSGEGLGGGRVVGWLPIVKEDKQHSGKPAFVKFKNAVWHASFLKILDCLAPLSRFGSAIKCWDDIICTFYLIVLILSADYEEHNYYISLTSKCVHCCGAVMALIRGLMGKFPCPVCLVPCDELSNTLKVFPLCTCTGTKALLAQAQESSTLDTREQILSSQSLRNVDSSFGVLEHTNLHFNDKGLFSDHTWPELQKWAAVQIDSFFQSIPCWQNLNHFDQVISVSFSDGTKYNDISKLIVFAAHNVFNHDTHPEAYLMLHCIQSYMVFNMYASLEVHTKDTINNGQEALSKLTELMDKYIEDTAEMSKKSQNFPKKHLSAHLFDNIEAKGVSQNYSTKPNEKMHGPLKDAYQDRTNFKNFTEQLLWYNHDSLIAEYICNKLDHLDTQNLSIFNNLEDQPDTALQKTHNSVAMSFTLIEAGSPGNPAFDRFRIKLNDFLNCAFAANSTDTGIIFGKLMFIFTCTVGDVQYPVTLVLPYDRPDKDFQFWRVKTKPRASAEFFSVQSIIQGCMIVEDASRPGEFLVVDTIDTDIVSLEIQVAILS